MAQLETYKGYYLWKYVPSQAGAVIFLLLFLTATAYHTWRIWKHKTYFCICFAIGGFCTHPFLPPVLPFSAPQLTRGHEDILTKTQSNSSATAPAPPPTTKQAA
jgi:hypothetical protein